MKSNSQHSQTVNRTWSRITQSEPLLEMVVKFVMKRMYFVIFSTMESENRRVEFSAISFIESVCILFSPCHSLSSISNIKFVLNIRGLFNYHETLL